MNAAAGKKFTVLAALALWACSGSGNGAPESSGPNDGPGRPGDSAPGADGGDRNGPGDGEGSGPDGLESPEERAHRDAVQVTPEPSAPRLSRLSAHQFNESLFVATGERWSRFDEFKGSMGQPDFRVRRVPR